MNTSFKEINRQYINWLDVLGFSKNITIRYGHQIHDFFEWLDTRGVSRINTLTQNHINQYFNYLENRPNKNKKGQLLSVSHLNHNFIAIDKLLEFLHTQRMQNTPFPTNYRMRVDKEERIQKIEIFTQDEIKTLYNNIENTYSKSDFKVREQKHYQLKLIFALYYACGLRLSEGLQLTADNIDFERRTVFVEKGKNYKDRFIPMSKGVFKSLEDYVFNFRNHLKLPHNRLFTQSNVSIYKSLNHLKNVCNDENIQQKRIYLHILRHSIATHLLQNGMSIENISQFLGHSSLTSTQIYTHFID